jgi:hypothetical protein
MASGSLNLDVMTPIASPSKSWLEAFQLVEDRRP